MLISDFFPLSYRDNYLNQKYKIETQDENIKRKLAIYGDEEIADCFFGNDNIQSAFFVFLGFYFNSVVFNEYFGLERKIEPFGDSFNNLLLNQYCYLFKNIDFTNEETFKNSLIIIIQNSLKEPINKKKYAQITENQELIKTLVSFVSKISVKLADSRDEIAEIATPLLALQGNLTLLKTQYIDNLTAEANHCIKIINYLI